MVQQCAGCELPIADKFLFKVLDRVWHANCVQCTDCKCSLTERCFSRDGKLFCKEDFYRRYGTKCSGCEQGISPNDLVRRAKHLVYHVDCFVCSFCKRQISTGDELYYMGEGSFICKDDYHRHHHHNINDEVEDDQKDLSYGLDEDLDAALSSKRRGPRTTIKAKQLEALRATFAATPKPSRSIREKLAQETGLNMRVIQVWFQNRRSKERRLKQSGGQTQSSRSTRPSRRTRNSRLDTREESNENESEIQSPKTPHLGYHPQAELSTQAPRYVSPSNFNDYYSPNSPISDGLLMNNSQVQHVGSDFGASANARANSMSDMADVNTLASVRHISNQSMNIVGPSPGGAGFNQVPEPQGSLVNSAPSDVW